MMHFDFSRFVDLGTSVTFAFVLATLIGAERQWRQRSAGLRTNVLVAVGAAAFVSIGTRLNGTAGAAQLASYVVSGIGFLGAGVIMKEGSKVWGLNTAATLWCSAAVGTLCGIGLPAEAVVVTIAVLAGNTFLRPLVNAINRAPVDEPSAEANYEIHVQTEAENVGRVRDILIEVMENASYPIADIVVAERGAESAEITATLMSNTVNPDELDRAVDQLGASSEIEHASWSSSTSG